MTPAALKALIGPHCRAMSEASEVTMRAAIAPQLGARHQILFLRAMPDRKLDAMGDLISH